MADQGQIKSEPGTQVTDALSGLNTHIDTTRELLGLLENSLSAQLRSEESVEPRKCQEEKVPLANGIEEGRDKIRDLNDKLRSLLSRLEV